MRATSSASGTNSRASRIWPGAPTRRRSGWPAAMARPPHACGADPGRRRRVAVEFRPWRFLLALAAAGAAVGGCRPPSPGAVGEPAAFSRTTGSAVQFTDRTEAAGLRFRHTNGAGGKRHLVETMGSGCAFLDADGDGWLDILLLNGRPLPHRSAAGRSFPALYRNQGDGTFRDVTDGSGLEVELYGMGCAVGDYDNDGRPDLYVSCALDESRLFHNEGGGHFRDVTSTAGVGNDRRWGASCAWVDYDQDGRLDLFVTNYLRYSLELEAPCLRAGQPIYCGPMAYPAERCRLYRNLGNGRFQDVSRAAGVDAVEGKSLGVAVWDFDGKNGPEILVANDVTPNFLFWNQGNGRFTEEGVVRGVAFAEDGSARAGMGIDVAQTGDAPGAAVLIANFSREPNTFLVQQPDGGFLDETYPSGMGTPSIPYLGFGLLLLDPDHDGLRDAVVANGH
ncbi:MAG: VCBS repeat-containing protein, partial [Armatimonadetes bacterium]|nr:VCBS repeat-containing protein [Armatimonadota bacterium]